VAGGDKVIRPDGASRALASARLPGHHALVRGLGLVEMCVGGAGLLDPRPATALAVAALYVGFALFLRFVIVSGVPSPSCGCAGRRDVPVSRLHIVLNLIAATAGALAAARPLPGGLPAFALRQPVAGIPFLAGEVTIAVLAYLAVVYLPTMFFSYRYRDVPDPDPAPAVPAGRAGVFRMTKAGVR
jgi:hypothetical protein